VLNYSIVLPAASLQTQKVFLKDMYPIMPYQIESDFEQPELKNFT
jgi:hypothetical protein